MCTERPVEQGWTMSPTRRVILCGVLLTSGLAAQAGLEEMTKIDRPSLKGKLSSLPRVLGDWVGHDLVPDPDVLRESQADDFLNREYECATRPGVRFRLWVNYSRLGNNLRHSPEICLPSGGVDQGRGRNAGWSQSSVPAVPRCESPGSGTRKVNWSRGSGSGTTSLEKDGWSISCEGCRSPAGAVTDGRRGGRG